MPSAQTRPSRQAFTTWETAALFKLEATRCAAAEAPLPADLAEKVAARVRKAHEDVDAVSTRYAAGELRTSAARKTVDGIVAQLKADLGTMLGERSAAFSARVDKTMGDVQLFSGTDPADGQLFVELSVKPDNVQKARIRARLNDTARRVTELDKSDPVQALAGRHALGFGTRAAIRAMLTPEQLKAFDGPFEAPAAAAAAPPMTAPAATGERRPGLSEAQAIALTRLEALRYAVVEGPYSAEVKTALADRIAPGTTRVREAPATAPASGFGADEERVGRIYAAVLSDTSKMLPDQAPDLIRRQGRIYRDVVDLSTGEPWHGKAALRKLMLSDLQQTQIDRVLADAADQLKALDAKSGRSQLTLEDPRVVPTHPKEKYADFFGSDRTLGPAARSLSRRKVGFETRAALREVLTPKQQAQWDAAESD